MKRAAFAVLMLSACGGSEGSDTYCDAASLSAALAAATSGTIVRVGACTIQGAFTVPAGVTLSGDSREASTIVALADQPALTINSGIVGDLTVETDGVIGILSRGSGSGSAEVRRVEIVATRGVGAGFEGLATLVLEDVELIGPVTPGNAGNFPSTITPLMTATHGLALVRVSNGQLTRVDTGGFAFFGALAIESVIQWTGGGARQNLGVGVFVESSTVTFANVAAVDTLGGFRFEPAYNLAAAGGSRIVATNLEVSGSQGHGMILDHSNGELTDLTANDNDESGVWAQSGASLELSGELIGNRLAGVVAHEVVELDVHDAQIDMTEAVLRIVEFASFEVGDGVQIIHAPWTTHRLTNVTLAGNERTGVLVDLDGRTLAADAFTDVEATATASTAYGVIVQNGTLPPAWDAEVTRRDFAVTNDAGFTGQLGTVEGVGPCYMPIADLRNGGLRALLGF
jgi:hypothetical protein